MPDQVAQLQSLKRSLHPEAATELPPELMNFNSYAWETTARISESLLQSTLSNADVSPALTTFPEPNFDP